MIYTITCVYKDQEVNLITKYKNGTVSLTATCSRIMAADIARHILIFTFIFRCAATAFALTQTKTITTSFRKYLNPLLLLYKSINKYTYISRIELWTITAVCCSNNRYDDFDERKKSLEARNCNYTSGVCIKHSLKNND